MGEVLEYKPTSAKMLRWVRAPQQERTRKTLGRLLDAAEKLFSEKGFDETTIAEIAAQAESSVGGFYRRFRDKDHLVQALHERFTEESRATAADVLDPERWTGFSVEQVLSEVAAFLVEVYREREGLLRTFLFRSAFDEIVQERQEKSFEYIADLLEVLLAGRMDAVEHPDPALAVRFALRVLVGTLDDTIQIRTTVPRLDDDRIVAELGRVLVRYLGVAEAPEK